MSYAGDDEALAHHQCSRRTSTARALRARSERPRRLLESSQAGSATGRSGVRKATLTEQGRAHRMLPLARCGPGDDRGRDLPLSGARRRMLRTKHLADAQTLPAHRRQPRCDAIHSWRSRARSRSAEAPARSVHARSRSRQASSDFPRASKNSAARSCTAAAESWTPAAWRKAASTRGMDGNYAR